tara:strand:+ start:696 stop:2081 length:1386 start_codon:yes stop_codon:yes gene_type:complete
MKKLFKHILSLNEAMKKPYMTKMDLKDFKKIKKGSEVLYLGSRYKVLKNNGYTLTLKGDSGKSFDVNLGMFNHGGQINEGKVNEANKAKKVISDLYKMDAQIDYLSDADEPTKKFWKRKGFNPEDDDLIILYSFVNHWPPTKKLLDKSKLKYAEYRDPNSAGESFIVFNVNEGNVNEGIEWQGILVKDATLKYNNKPTGGPGLEWVGQSYAKVPKGTFLIGLPGGLFAVNMKKKFAMALTTGRREWLDAQDKLKGNEVGGTNMAPEFREWKKYLNESVNERRDEWKQEREYIKQMADDNKSSVYKMADYVQFLGLMNQRQWEKFMYGMYKKDLQKTDPKTKNRIYKAFVKMFEGNVEEVYDGKKKKKKKKFHPDMMYELSSAQDGTSASDGKHKHEDHIEEDIMTMWKKTYGEDFRKHYPAIAKIIKQRPGMDRRELARIWNDTYGENFEEEYPALWNKLK